METHPQLINFNVNVLSYFQEQQALKIDCVECENLIFDHIFIRAHLCGMDLNLVSTGQHIPDSPSPKIPPTLSAVTIHPDQFYSHAMNCVTLSLVVRTVATHNRNPCYILRCMQDIARWSAVAMSHQHAHWWRNSSWRSLIDRFAVFSRSFSESSALICLFVI